MYYNILFTVYIISYSQSAFLDSKYLLCFTVPVCVLATDTLLHYRRCSSLCRFNFSIYDMQNLVVLCWFMLLCVCIWFRVVYGHLLAIQPKKFGSGLLRLWVWFGLVKGQTKNSIFQDSISSISNYNSTMKKWEGRKLQLFIQKEYIHIFSRLSSSNSKLPINTLTQFFLFPLHTDL